MTWMNECDENYDPTGRIKCSVCNVAIEQGSSHYLVCEVDCDGCSEKAHKALVEHIEKIERETEPGRLKIDQQPIIDAVLPQIKVFAEEASKLGYDTALDELNLRTYVQKVHTDAYQKTLEGVFHSLWNELKAQGVELK